MPLVYLPLIHYTNPPYRLHHHPTSHTLNMPTKLTVICREVAQCIEEMKFEVTCIERQPIDYKNALRQQQAYFQVFRDLVASGKYNIEFIEMPPLADLPDCLFVEDVGMIYNHAVIATRPGAPSRRPEVAPMLENLKRLAAEKKAADEKLHPAYFAKENFLQVAEPGTVDGGDVLHVRNSKYVFVGQSTRTNADALAQVTAFLKGFDLEVVPVHIKGCLHVKCAATFLSEKVVLIDPKLMDGALFTSRGFEVVETSSEEVGGSNVVQFQVEERENPNQKLSVILSSQACPKTGAKIAAWVEAENQKDSANVYKHIMLDLSEAAKAEGDVTCQSLISYCTY